MKAPMLVMIVGGFLLVLSPALDMPSIFPPSEPAIERPQDRLARLVDPIMVVDFAEADADSVSEFCLAFADLLDRDAKAKVIVDTGDLRDMLDESSRLMFQATGIDQRHPELPATINDVLAKWLEIETADGVEVVGLDDDKHRRALASEAFEAVAWAAEQ